jgi:hypothetical protein
MNSSRKPAAGFWFTVALVAVLVGYPLSFGPMQWLFHQGFMPQWAELPCHYFYRPLAWTCGCFQPMRNALDWYVSLWME